MFVVLIVMNRRHIYSLTPYILVGIVLWYCVFMSGVHSTIAGVLLAFAIPSGSRVNLKSFASWSGKRVKEANDLYEPNDPVIGQKDYITAVAKLSMVAKQVVPPATRLENMLYPWVYFAILPLFALTNADVSFVSGNIGAIFADPAFYGVFFGLLLGKPIGIMLFSFIIIKTKLASLPEHANWGHMFGAGILGGVGFTMAIFVANLAFDDAAVITAAKLAILSASLIAGVVGFLVLFIQANAARKKGVAYIAASSDEVPQQASDKEYLEASRRMLDEIESPLLKEEIEAAQREGDGFAEIVVDLGADEQRSDKAAVEGKPDPDRDGEDAR